MNKITKDDLSDKEICNGRNCLAVATRDLELITESLGTIHFHVCRSCFKKIKKL